jgi:multiple antibiotic resistance protein
MLGLGEIFTLFFVTLGPMKLLGPYAQQTHGLDPVSLRGISIRVFVIGLVAIVIGGYVGTSLAAQWRITLPAILIATGIIFFLVAINVVMAVYAPMSEPAKPSLPATPIGAALRLTFPLVVTPYGIAALIAVLSATDDPVRTKDIYLILLAVMLLNLLAMLFIRQIMHPAVLLGLQVFGAVLGVLQVGLAVQIIIGALRSLHALTE